ncbi:L,D-transpeptidase family protein [Sphingomonas montana]|uniref:L,D-transpeptidase family protein n=1 Tax=Sphingomonas montana TaxID=1843236 RepID=UPI00096BE3EA|nr:L,D-transpeptidase family protein [Sphingomonas montana]
MTRLWPTLVAAVLALSGCGGPPVLPVDPAALDDRHCAGGGVRECTLLATGDGTFVLAVPGLPTRPARRVARPASVAAAGGGGVRVLISLPQQKLYAFRGKTLVATSPVSTGKRGHATPAGTFRVLQKAVTHHSNRYSNAPMPYMQRLTTYGIAIHAGALPGYPASHGCIRLPRSFARTLYRMTRNGTVVTITRARPGTTAQALALS